MRGLGRAALVVIALLATASFIGCGSGGDGGGNGRITFQSGGPLNPNIFVMDGNGADTLFVIGNAREPSVNPVGNTVIFARGADIFATDLTGIGLTNLTQNEAGVTASNPAFDRLGQRIAYVLMPTVPGAETIIRLMDANGENEFDLVARGNDPDFSPDGTQIVFTSGPDLFLINIDGTNLVQLTNHPTDAVVSSPSFDPLGDEIAFEFRATSGATPSVRILNTGSLSETTLVTNAAQPTFSPFGDRVAFVRGGAIFSIATNGTDLRQLSDGPNDAEPDWTPDP